MPERKSPDPEPPSPPSPADGPSNSDGGGEPGLLCTEPKRPPRLTPEGLRRLWNERNEAHEGLCVAAEKLNGTREKAAWARLKERPDWGLAEWAAYFDKHHASRFCTGRESGRDGRRPFRSNFEYAVRGETITKALEGSAPFAEEVADAEIRY